MLPFALHALIFMTKTQAQCMKVWCKAFCRRHINLKIVFQSASEHVIFIQKIEKFFGERHSPSQALHLTGVTERSSSFSPAPTLHHTPIGAYICGVCKVCATIVPSVLNPWSPFPHS